MSPLTDMNSPPSPGDVHEQALLEGRMLYQACLCGHRWLPPRHECPLCLGPQWTWKQAGGRGHLVSWVVYRVAYHEAFKNRIPYNVAIVELAEGFRIISNIIGHPDGKGLSVDMPLAMKIEIENGMALARFVPIDTPSPQ